MSKKVAFSLFPTIVFSWERVSGKMKLKEIGFVFLWFSKIWNK